MTKTANPLFFIINIYCAPATGINRIIEINRIRSKYHIVSTILWISLSLLLLFGQLEPHPTSCQTVHPTPHTSSPLEKDRPFSYQFSPFRFVLIQMKGRATYLVVVPQDSRGFLRRSRCLFSDDLWKFLIWLRKRRYMVASTDSLISTNGVNTRFVYRSEQILSMWTQGIRS